jgi:transposase InsO family protein
MLFHSPTERGDPVGEAHLRFSSTSNYRWLLLSVILDACTRKVVGYGVSKRLDTPPALTALHSAIENRKPPPGCIHHTHRGCPIRR